MNQIMTIRPPEELKKQLQEKAEEIGIPLNSLVIQILWDYLEPERK